MRLLRASLAVAAVAVKPGDYFEEACHEDALTDHDLSHVAEHQHHHPYVHEGKTSPARACASFEVMWNMNMFDIEEICGGECPHEVNLPHHFYYDHRLSTLKVDAQHYRLEADLAKVLGDAEHEARLSQLAEAADLVLAEELYHDYDGDDKADGIAKFLQAAKDHKVEYLFQAAHAEDVSVPDILARQHAKQDKLRRRHNKRLKKLRRKAMRRAGEL